MSDQAPGFGAVLLKKADPNARKKASFSKNRIALDALMESISSNKKFGKMATYSITCISGLAVDEPSTEEVIESGAVETLLTLLDKHPGNVQVKKSVAAIMQKLCKYPSTAELLSKRLGGRFDRLAKLSDLPDGLKTDIEIQEAKKIQLRALKMFSTLAPFHDNINDYKKCGVWEKIVKIIEQNKDEESNLARELMRSAAGCLKHGINDPEVMETFMNSGALEALLLAGHRFIDDPVLAQYIAEILAKVAATGNTDYLVRLKDAGALEALYALMSQNPTNDLLHAAVRTALSYLTDESHILQPISVFHGCSSIDAGSCKAIATLAALFLVERNVIAAFSDKDFPRTLVAFVKTAVTQLISQAGASLSSMERIRLYKAIEHALACMLRACVGAEGVSTARRLIEAGTLDLLGSAMRAAVNDLGRYDNESLAYMSTLIATATALLKVSNSADMCLQSAKSSLLQLVLKLLNQVADKTDEKHAAVAQRAIAYLHVLGGFSDSAACILTAELFLISVKILMHHLVCFTISCAALCTHVVLLLLLLCVSDSTQALAIKCGVAEQLVVAFQRRSRVKTLVETEKRKKRDEEEKRGIFGIYRSDADEDADGDAAMKANVSDLIKSASVTVERTLLKAVLECTNGSFVSLPAAAAALNSNKAVESLHRCVLHPASSAPADSVFVHPEVLSEEALVQELALEIVQALSNPAGDGMQHRRLDSAPPPPPPPMNFEIDDDEEESKRNVTAAPAAAASNKSSSIMTLLAQVGQQQPLVAGLTAAQDRELRRQLARIRELEEGGKASRLVNLYEVKAMEPPATGPLLLARNYVLNACMESLVAVNLAGKDKEKDIFEQFFDRGTFHRLLTRALELNRDEDRGCGDKYFLAAQCVDLSCVLQTADTATVAEHGLACEAPYTANVIPRVNDYLRALIVACNWEHRRKQLQEEEDRRRRERGNRFDAEVALRFEKLELSMKQELEARTQLARRAREMAEEKLFAIYEEGQLEKIKKLEALKMQMKADNQEEFRKKKDALMKKYLKAVNLLKVAQSKMDLKKISWSKGLVPEESDDDNDYNDANEEESDDDIQYVDRYDDSSAQLKTETKDFLQVGAILTKHGKRESTARHLYISGNCDLIIWKHAGVSQVKPNQTIKLKAFSGVEKGAACVKWLKKHGRKDAEDREEKLFVLYGYDGEGEERMLIFEASSKADRNAWVRHLEELHKFSYKLNPNRQENGVSMTTNILHIMTVQMELQKELIAMNQL